MSDVSFALAFLAGILSFLSPCVLPMIPAYVSIVSGVSLEELQNRKHITAGMGRMISFIAGVSTIFMAMGASSSLLGNLFLEYQDYIRIGGGILTIIFGLFVAGIIRLDFLMRERRFDFSRGPAGYVGSFLTGMGFAAGWTPCIGPILGSILLYAGSQASAAQGTALLAVYSAGFAVPFILSALAIKLFLKNVAALQRHMRVIMTISGLVLVAFGIILLTDNFTWLSRFFPEIDLKL
jgi:cytochrome c-type biogenesis protein